MTLPEISRLVEQQKVGAAIRVAREAERIVPANVARLRRETWFAFSIRTEPPGADVFMKPYLDVGAGRVSDGRSRPYRRAWFGSPAGASRPYQTVVFFPHSGARIARSTADMDMSVIDIVVRSGRALCYPVYRDTYERHVERTASSQNFRRDLVIQWSKDLGRALDWLETRPDVAKGRLAYYGVSLGANDGVTLLGVENRFRAAVLLIAGRYDFQHPVETAQNPLFRTLGPVAGT